MMGFCEGLFSTNDTDQRAVSTSVGFILIIGVVVTGISVLLITGTVLITESQSQASVESVNNAMSQFDSEISMVAFGGAQERTIDLSLSSNEQVYAANHTRISIELQYQNATGDSDTTTLYSQKTQSIVYKSNGRKVAYEGGGVWMIPESGNKRAAQMVSPPEYTSSGHTLTLPIVSTKVSGTLNDSDGRLTISNPDTKPIFPDLTNDELQNPLSSDHQLAITISSPYYRGWGEYFSSRTKATPIYDHDNDSVKVIVEAKSEPFTVENAIQSVRPSSTIYIKGQGGNVFIDSYDSRNGPYTASQTTNGTITAGSGIDMRSGAQLYGDAVVDGDIVLRGGSKIHGNATLNGNIISKGGGKGGGGKGGGKGGGGKGGGKGGGGKGGVTGEVRYGVDVSEAPPADYYIASVYNVVKTNNDNDDPTRISGGSINDERELTSDDVTIKSGNYYLSSFKFDNAEITFDLSDGNITVFSGGAVSLSDSTIDVVNTAGNDNTVRVYTLSKTIAFEGSSVHVPNDAAGRMLFFGGAGTVVDLHGHSKVVGAIYAAGTQSNPGAVDITTHSELFGGVIGGETWVQAHSAVHYDAALADSPIFLDDITTGQRTLELQYFHVSETTVKINDG